MRDCISACCWRIETAGEYCDPDWCVDNRWRSFVANSIRSGHDPEKQYMNETNRIPAIVDEGAFGKILANAKRLADDSRLLIENERTYSAILLAIFANEELGTTVIGGGGGVGSESCRERWWQPGDE